jgi:peptide deformylase
MLRVLQYPDPLLLKPTAEVTAFDDDLRTLIDDMIHTMDAYGAIGLAANQVGDPRRVCVTRHKSFRSGLSCIWVNPRITKRDGKHSGPEGCLSFPGVELEVPRSAAIVVEYQDHLGNHKGESLAASQTFTAIILQHEIDHLDGAVFIDRLFG